MAVARATMLAMRMERNKGENWREMLEEESAKKGIKLEMQGKGVDKVMSGLLVLELGGRNRDRGRGNGEFHAILVSLQYSGALDWV